MSKVAVKKVAAADNSAAVLSDAKVYARKIWLAGLGVYVKAGLESVAYFNELVKSGEGVEQQGKKLVNKQVEAANGQIGSFKQTVSSVKDKVEVRLDMIERAFDSRVASALNRLGIASQQDVEGLSAKLDELSALLEHVARTK
jgi:poly(hydroxyalkanoate) granule-associated protein